MPDFGQPVAQNVQPPSGLQTLSSLMNLQQQQLNLRKSQDTYAADVSQRQSESALAGTNASVAAQTAAPRVAQQVAQTGLDQFKLTGAQAAQSMQLASGLVGDPDFVNGNGPAMVDKLNGAEDTMVKQFGVDPKVADATITTLKYQALHNPGQVRQSLINMTQQQQGGAGQQNAALPAPQMVNNGQSIKPVAAGNPALTGGPAGAPQGSPIPQQLPPTTRQYNPVTKQMEYVGSSAQGGPVASGPPLGAQAGIEANVNDMNTHFSGLQNASQGTALISGLTGNIKALAAKAITGTESDRQSYVNGVLNALGAGDKASGNLQTDTDLMRKQLAMINTSTPASTDAKQSLIQAAQPNSHMNAPAIAEAADQVASQVQLNMAMRNKLSATKYANGGQGDPAAYQAMRQQLETIDPRALQWKNLGPGSPEAQQYLQTLKPTDRQQLRNSVETAQKFGIM